MARTITNPDPWLSVQDAANWTNFTHHTIRRAITAGHLKASQPAAGGGSRGVLRIRLSDLESWMNESTAR